MRNQYSKPLYDLYREGNEFFKELEPDIDFLATDASGMEQIEKNFLLGLGVPISPIDEKNCNIRSFANDQRLKDTYDCLIKFRNEWNKKVVDILQALPQYSFRMRFEDGRDVKMLKSMDYFNIDFSDDMQTLLNSVDELKSKIDELPFIIDDYEKSVFQPADFNENMESEQDSKDKKIAFILDYDGMSGAIKINGKVVHKCQLDSFLDRALMATMREPGKPIKTRKNIATSIHSIKIPKELRNLLFRTGNTSIIVKPIITEDDVAEAGYSLNQILIDLEKMQEH